MSYVIVPAMEVRVCGLSQPTYITVTEMTASGGIKKFFELRKSDKKLERLLCPSAEPNKSRSLARTTIIETIKKLRDDAVWARLRARKRKRCTNEDQAAIIMMEDTFAEIAIPHMHGMGVKYMNVKMEKPGTKELQVEFTEDNLEYLSEVIKMQLDGPVDDDIDRFDNKGDKGVTFSRGRNAIVAKKKGVHGCKNGVKYKIFPIDKYVDRDAALEAAIEYMNEEEDDLSESGEDEEHVVGNNEDEPLSGDNSSPQPVISVGDVSIANAAGGCV